MRVPLPGEPIGVPDGAPVLFVVTDFSKQPYADQAVEAFAIGDHAVIGQRTLMGGPDEPERDVRTLGWLRPDSEGIRWCRGRGEKEAAALVAAVALARNR